jgi:hypothetical protein
LTGDSVHHVADKAPKRFVLDKLFIDLRVVFQEILHRFAQCLVVRNARGVPMLRGQLLPLAKNATRVARPLM